jgi:hypothetical protein
VTDFSPPYFGLVRPSGFKSEELVLVPYVLLDELVRPVGDNSD